MILRTVWLTEMLALAILFVLTSILFLIEAKKTNNPILRKYYVAIALFMLIFGLNGFLDYFAQHAIHVLGQDDFLPENMRFLTVGQNSFLIMITLLQLGFAVLSYVIETFITNSERKYLHKTLLVCFGISFLSYLGPLVPTDYHELIYLIVNATLIPFALIIVYWGVFYLRLAKNSPGSVRKKALMVAFGLGFLFFGIIMDTMYRGAVFGEYALPIFFKSVSLIGVPLLIFGFRRKDL